MSVGISNLLIDVEEKEKVLHTKLSPVKLDINASRYIYYVLI